jgi:hypothetical protein
LATSLNTQLRRLGRAVEDQFPSINYGGCGVYAAAVAERLQALGVQVDVCVSDSGHESSVEAARNNLRHNGWNPTNANARQWTEAGLSFAHLGVRFKHKRHWYVHDTAAIWQGRTRGLGAHRRTGSVFDDHGPRYEVLPDGMTPAEARAIADDPRGWNSTFDRDDIPEVRRMVAEWLP